ncbi:MAG: hypothetical protein ACQ5SW_10355 [Sphaerochaetaceae bacterium]
MAVGTATALIGGSLLGAAGSAYAAKKSSDAISDASDASTALQTAMYEDTKGTLMPYIEAGQPAIDRQQALLGLQGTEAQQQAFSDFSTSPAFDWQREQVIGDVNRSASTGGMLQSGNRLAALTDRLQGLYSQEYSNYFNQLGSQSGLGLSAASALGGVSTSSAQGQAATMQNAAQAQAAGYQGIASSLGSGLSDITAIYANQDNLSNLWG